MTEESEEMTDSERVSLINDVYDRVYRHTESFNVNHIGSSLAYLLGAIGMGSAYAIQSPADEDEEAFTCSLRCSFRLTTRCGSSSKSREKMDNRTEKLLENAIAIAGDVFGSSDYEAFRDKFENEIECISSVYRDVRLMAEALTDYEIKGDIDWGAEGPEWLEVTEALAEAYLETLLVPDVATVYSELQ